MKNWKTAGFIATIIIVFSLPLHHLKEEYGRAPQSGVAPEPVGTFVGSKKCEACHRKTYEKWQNFHHDHAMDIASERTVLEIIKRRRPNEKQ